MNSQFVLRRGAVRSLLFLASVACAAGSMSAGEKIIFSGRVDRRAAVDLARKDPLQGAGLHTPKIGGDSPADALSVVAPTPTIIVGGRMTRQQQEEMDQRRNWMFQDPQKAAPKKTDAKAGNENPDDATTEPKSSVERFLERKDAAVNPADATREFSEQGSRRDGANRDGSRRVSLRDGGRSTGEGEKDFLGDGAARDLVKPPRDGLNGGGATEMRGFDFARRVPLDPARAHARAAEQEADMAAFRQFLNPGAPAASAPGAGFNFNAPANSPIYITSGPASPSRTAGFDAPSVRPGGADEPRGFGGSPAGPKFGGDPFAPSPAATEPPRKPEPRPTVFEIPKRKF